jgi:hypothetical protein
MSEAELRNMNALRRGTSGMPEALVNPKLAVRRNMRSRFIWELLTKDGHVVNRSDDDFETFEGCQADAEARGHK